MCSSRIVWFRLQLLLTSCKRKLFFKLQEYKKYISRADTLPNIIAITGLTPFKLKLRLTWDWGFRGLDRPWEKPSATFISFITAHDTNNFLKHFFYNSNTLKMLFCLRKYMLPYPFRFRLLRILRAERKNSMIKIRIRKVFYSMSRKV